MYMYHFLYKHLKWFGVALPHHWCMYCWSSYNPLPPIWERFPPLSYHLVEGKPLDILGPIRSDIPHIFALLVIGLAPSVVKVEHNPGIQLRQHESMTAALHWTFSSISLSSKVHCAQLNTACSSIKRGNGGSTWNTICVGPNKVHSTSRATIVGHY